MGERKARETKKQIGVQRRKLVEAQRELLRETDKWFNHGVIDNAKKEVAEAEKALESTERDHERSKETVITTRRELQQVEQALEAFRHTEDVGAAEAAAGATAGAAARVAAGSKCQVRDFFSLKSNCVGCVKKCEV